MLLLFSRGRSLLCGAQRMVARCAMTWVTLFTTDDPNPTKKTAPRVSGRCQLKTNNQLSKDQRQEYLPCCHFDGHNSCIAEFTKQLCGQG